MRILVYKRTHNGDPDHNGCFGVYDCMGVVRNRDFNAVVGVGGIGPEARNRRIAGKVNWVGIGPHKNSVSGKRGSEITFDHFIDFGTDGPNFYGVAPTLAERMYSRNARHVIDLNEQEYDEATSILRMAENAPPSKRHQTMSRRRCQSHQHRNNCVKKKC